MYTMLAWEIMNNPPPVKDIINQVLVGYIIYTNMFWCPVRERFTIMLFNTDKE